MSWIVQSLWSNREIIRNKSHLYAKEYRDFNFFLNYDLAYYGEGEAGEYIQNDSFSKENGYDDPFIEDEQFNDLLAIEKAIDDLKKLCLLSPSDLKILYSYKEDYYTKKQKEVYARKLYYLCDRIAYYLGGYFTDEGYINYLTRKYNLTGEQIRVLREYIKSEFKNKTLKKGYKIEQHNENTQYISA